MLYIYPLSLLATPVITGTQFDATMQEPTPRPTCSTVLFPPFIERSAIRPKRLCRRLVDWLGFTINLWGWREDRLWHCQAVGRVEERRAVQPADEQEHVGRIDRAGG